MFEESGIFLVDKEPGLTSHDVIAKIKKKFDIKKIGHAGTLDPMATGMLVVLVNQATKISDYLLNEVKEYIFKIKFFIETDSLDITGNITNQVDEFKLSKKDILNVIDKYNGYIYDQEPPMYSAIKINGKKLLDYALEDKTEILDDIKKRTIKINELELIKFDKKTFDLELRALCSKGTYIRSLARDIAKDLNTIGVVSELRRTKSGVFDVLVAKKIDDLQVSNLISLYSTIEINGFPLVQYPNERDIFIGKRIELINIKENSVFIINKKGDVIAVYERIVKDIFACKRGLWTEDMNIYNKK